jgi:hypothetical protein
VEIIDPLPSTETRWNIAVVQAKRNDENGSLGLLVGHVKSELYLLLNVTLFGRRAMRQADNHHTAALDCLSNLEVPILPALDILDIQPRVEPLRSESMIKLTHALFVAGRMTEKNLHLMLRRAV